MELKRRESWGTLRRGIRSSSLPPILKDAITLWTNGWKQRMEVEKRKHRRKEKGLKKVKNELKEKLSNESTHEKRQKTAKRDEKGKIKR
ncbi:hypothetical protein NPIL_335991 [Nephila pilipes]|uniref:Uncharacterized protein n=1 Tax=Nephila pilipes TaxID=299642 RepID=A0A8X6P5Z0_NEPPI|nr:hypothetical protein NPIL_335991 [Nephila pilipes]